MKIAEREITVLVSDTGREVLKSLTFDDSAVHWIYVQHTDELGIWVRVRREDGNHLVLLRWDFVLGMDFSAGETKVIGVQG